MQLTGLTGNAFLITGGGSGMGAAIAAELARSGASVAIADRDKDASEATRAELSDAGGRVGAWTVDVTDSAAVEAAVEAAEAELGPLRGLVNAAGTIGTGQRAVELSAEEWERTFAINTRGVFNCSTAVARRMIPRRAGAIVTVASNTAKVLRMGQTAYASSKAASAYFTRCLGLELAEFGIRCNVVNPGVTDTPMARKFWTDPARREQQIRGDLDRFRVGIPLGKLGTPNDMANAVVFLLSDQAGHVTTADLLVDGGSTLSI